MTHQISSSIGTLDSLSFWAIREKERDEPIFPHFLPLPLSPWKLASTCRVADRVGMSAWIKRLLTDDGASLLAIAPHQVIECCFCDTWFATIDFGYKTLCTESLFQRKFVDMISLIKSRSSDNFEHLKWSPCAFVLWSFFRKRICS